MKDHLPGNVTTYTLFILTVCRIRLHYGPVPTPWYGYHSPQDTHSVVLDPDEHINTVTIHYGVLDSTIHTGGVQNMITAFTFRTSKGVFFLLILKYSKDRLIRH